MNPRAFLRVSTRAIAFLGLAGLSSSFAEGDYEPAPVGGIEILVENVANGQMAATRTADTGHFTVSGLAPGEYRLIIGMAPRTIPPGESSGQSTSTPPAAIGYDVRLSVYGGAMTAQWVPASSPKMRVGIVFAVPARASGTIAGSIRTAAPPAVQTQITWVAPPSFD